ncbi:MAG: DUF2927 domain-containing protein [Cognatishimia sp.]
MTKLGATLAGLVICALSACEIALPTKVAPTPVAVPLPATPSAASKSIKRYYANLQNDLLAQGLMRDDGGGADTTYTADMLARNFERIAFYDEHQIGARLQDSTGEARLLARWDMPVRMSVEFGPSVGKTQITQDRETVSSFAKRLAQVTDHPISTVRARANFHVLVVGEDDRPAMAPRLTDLLPSLTTAHRALLQNLPRDMHCLVIVSHSDTDLPRILSAVAIVRAEHPDLLRKACFHEEIAQGFGLVNDSPQARPSIFNYDDEFALLTSHDEALLNMLYDQRLSIGMTAEQARPIIRILAHERVGQDL